MALEIMHMIICCLLCASWIPSEALLLNEVAARPSVRAGCNRDKEIQRSVAFHSRPVQNVFHHIHTLLCCWSTRTCPNMNWGGSHEDTVTLCGVPGTYGNFLLCKHL